MLRRSLFWGLTLVLIVALTFLIVRGCRLEKKQAQQLVETVEESKPTATRVLAPPDLKIVQAKIEMEPGVGGKRPSQTARQEIEISNGGKVPYREIQLGFAYLGRNGKVVEKRTHSIVQTILPGATLKMPDIRVENIPPSAVSFQATIIYADIGSSAAPKQ